MANDLIVEIKDLQSCAAILFSELAASGRVVQIPQEFYWSIKSEDRYNMGLDAPHLTIGALSEDMTQMRNLISAGESEGALNQHLIWLSALLLAIAEKSSFLREERKTTS